MAKWNPKPPEQEEKGTWTYGREQLMCCRAPLQVALTSSLRAVPSLNAQIRQSVSEKKLDEPASGPHLAVPVQDSGILQQDHRDPRVAARARREDIIQRFRQRSKILKKQSDKQEAAYLKMLVKGSVVCGLLVTVKPTRSVGQVLCSPSTV